MRLKGSAELERSPTVANSAMNRERGLEGANSYSKDLKHDLLNWLVARAVAAREVGWLDLCCGSGRALAEAAGRLSSQEQVVGKVSIVGVDLVASHDRRADQVPGLRIVEANLDQWEPIRTFDLVTCVHGLHYVGDKLALIQRALSWVRPGGIFLANLDLTNLKWADGRSAGRWAAQALRSAGLSWSPRTRVLMSDGPRTLSLGVEFVGADDDAGPNYTGQPAVSSHYCRQAAK